MIEPAAHVQAQVPTPTPSVTPTPSETEVSPTQETIDPAEIAEERLAAQVEALLASMTVADRVGQLFIISFSGNDTSYNSDIAELIFGYRIGGVILSPQYQNFSNEKGVDTPLQVATLANQLQALAYGILLPSEQALLSEDSDWTPSNTGSLAELTGAPPLELPLFIGVQQLGDNLPYTALRNRFTPLPSQLALGATWDPELTRRVGQIVGRELAAVGINFLLGPNLDVLEQPRPDQVGSLGTQSFGGDPYWVSQLARAYIWGVHEGGNGQVAAIARHFPGAGDIDRLPDEEVATVQRTLQELQRLTLPPFEAVARQPSSILNPYGDPAAADGFMSSHTRYSGIQGTSTGRNTPLSLAPELEMIINQERFAIWRNRGGLLVSNSLGVPAIRRYYSPGQEEFPYKRVVLDAFTAGHDLLFLDQFSLDGQWKTEMENIRDTIVFFQERYIDDSDFAAQVDQSVRRILRVKLRLYADQSQPEAGEVRSNAPISPAAVATSAAVASATLTATVAPPTIALEKALVHESELDLFPDPDGEDGEDSVAEEENSIRAESLVTVGNVARRAITLLYPDSVSTSDFSSIELQPGDKLLIFTESRLLKECKSCTVEVAIGPDALADTIVEFYGPDATGVITEGQIIKLTFSDLAQILSFDDASAAAEESEASPTSTSTPVPAPPPETEPGTAVAESADTDSAEVELSTGDKINRHIEQADWVVFAMLDVASQEQYPYSDVVKRFLRQRGDQLNGKHIIVLALHAPNFLDATEISKLSGYYGIYSKTQPFLDGAVRALFRGYTPTGAPPISVPGTRFGNLADRLLPDPGQEIPLQLFGPDGEAVVDEPEDSDSALPSVDAGTVMRMQAGPLKDLNGTLVRDGTQVEFIVSYDGEETPAKIETTSTRNGLAVRDVLMERGGVVRISARGGNAASSEAIALSIEGPPATPTPSTDASQVAVTAPISAPDSVSVTQLVTVAGQPLENTLATDPAAATTASGARVNLVSLVLALLTIVGLISFLLIVQVRMLPRQILVHSMLWAVNCGLFAYVLYGLGWMPGSAWIYASMRTWGAAIVVFVGMLFPLVWLQLRIEQ